MKKRLFLRTNPSKIKEAFLSLLLFLWGLLLFGASILLFSYLSFVLMPSFAEAQIKIPCVRESEAGKKHFLSKIKECVQYEAEEYNEKVVTPLIRLQGVVTKLEPLSVQQLKEIDALKGTLRKQEDLLLSEKKATQDLLTLQKTEIAFWKGQTAFWEGRAKKSSSFWREPALWLALGVLLTATSIGIAKVILDQAASTAKASISPLRVPSSQLHFQRVKAKDSVFFF